jgi:serine/threonine-protein kinase
MARELKPGDTISEYVLEAEIGRGGFARVGRARHKHLSDNLVAVTVPDNPEFVRQLLVEGQAQHRLNHPSIVRTVGLDLDADPPYFIMEYVDGKSLRAILKESKRLDVRQSVRLFQEVLSGLDFAHRHGVLQLDVKPENILVGKDGHAKLRTSGSGAQPRKRARPSFFRARSRPRGSRRLRERSPTWRASSGKVGTSTRARTSSRPAWSSSRC